MDKPYPLLFELQQLTVDLAHIERRHYLPKTKRHENDIEHSFSVALLCWYIHSTLQLDLNASLILKYAMAHDFVERYAGDVSSFASKEARDQKIIDEQKSLLRLSAELSAFPDLVATMQNYEEKADEESRFVWTVDKMQALILGDLDTWNAYKEGGISYDRFVEKYTSIAEVSSKYCKEIFQSLITYCKQTYRSN